MGFRALTITTLLLLNCGCSNKELSVSGENNTNAIGIVFEAVIILSDQIRIPVSYENTLDINLTAENVSLVSDQGVSCTITILNGDSVRPQIVLTLCTGTGQYYLVIAEGSASSTSGVLSARTQSDLYTLE